MSGFFLLADQRARPNTPSPEEAIPGYSANKANKDTNQVIALPVPSRGGVETSSSGQASSSTSPSEECACIVCLAIGTFNGALRGPYKCRVASCNWSASAESQYPFITTIIEQRVVHEIFITTITEQRVVHEQSHYRQGPTTFQTPFSCLVENCRFSSKRWPDLYRHTSAKHCLNPARFACSVIGCKYSGEGNGFTRKDKLTSHYNNMHKGQKVPGQAVRAIKPAPASSHAEASGSSSMGAQGE